MNMTGQNADGTGAHETETSAVQEAARLRALSEASPVIVEMFKEMREAQKRLEAALEVQARTAILPRRLFHDMPGGPVDPPTEGQDRRAGKQSLIEIDQTPEVAQTLEAMQVAPITAQGDTSSPTKLSMADALEEFWRRKMDQSMLDYDLRPPYPGHVAKMTFPSGYTTPSFPQYSGKGNAKLHLNKFVDALGMHSGNENLCLREFSKSLSDKAYTWYSGLQANSVHSWKEMTKMFMTKFFTVEEKVTMADLGREKQAPSDDLVSFVKRFRELTLDCTDPVSETTLVALCIEGMSEEYKVFLENLRIATFTELIEAAKRTSLSVKKRVKETRTTRGVVMAASSTPEKRKFEGGYKRNDNYERGHKSPKKGKFAREDLPPPFPIPLAAVIALYQNWVRDGDLDERRPHKPPSDEEQKHPRYCIHHQVVGHATEDCYTLRRLVNRKFKDGLIIVDGNQVKDVEHAPYPPHGGGERHRVNMIIGDEEGTPLPRLGEYPNHMTERLMVNRKFKAFFDSMGFTLPARKAATESLIKVSEEYAEECFVSLDKMYRAPTVTFTNGDMMLHEPHSFALHIEVDICGMTFPRALVDTGASLNLMPAEILDALGIPRAKLGRTNVQISGIANIPQQAIGYVVVEMGVGPIKHQVKFHVVEVGGDWQLILGRTWIHELGAVPSSYHQCLKFWHQGKEVRIEGSRKAIVYEVEYRRKVEEAHDRNCASCKRKRDYPRIEGIPLPKNECTPKRQGNGKGKSIKRVSESSSSERVERVQLKDGRIAYRL